MKALSEAEYLKTMRAPMREVTAVAEAVVDIWPGVRAVAAAVGVPPAVVQQECVAQVYQSADGAFDHVLAPTERQRVFLVVIVSRLDQTIHGYYPLNLNEKYGLENAERQR